MAAVLPPLLPILRVKYPEAAASESNVNETVCFSATVDINTASTYLKHSDRITHTGERQLVEGGYHEHARKY